MPTEKIWEYLILVKQLKTVLVFLGIDHVADKLEKAIENLERELLKLENER
ncbi:hypothetical protein LCGC14_2181290 [marine sediment metagenome]|uniref:Uncharacterized protein n=1 Tax=marine sediment metagenome TaxID=412755 RepID=A0A0F9DM95_9ZZZZ